MNSIRTLLFALFFGALLVRVLTALSIHHAGYFDAFYYYHLAVNMAEGKGLVESVIWNYLDDPQQLPRPGNQYWMPLTNIWAWGGIELFGGVLGPWRAAQLPFVLCSALLPTLAAWLSWQEWQRRDWAIGAAVLTIFSGFYFTYWVTTDNFTPFALTVALTLLGAWQGQQRNNARWWAVAGVGAGLSHLARADGALLGLLVASLLGWHYLWRARTPATFVRYALAALLGYLLCMGPWWFRNWLVVGTPFPGGGTQTLWMRSYAEIFSYQIELTPARYLAWGSGPIISSKMESVFWSAFLVLGSMQFFLAPFILIALRDALRRPLFQPFLLYTLMLLTVMPLVFTFPARHGSLLHSTAALLPWMMALAPPGMDRTIRWLAARRRKWNPEQATRMLSAGFVALSAIITLYIYNSVVGLDLRGGAANRGWNERTRIYEEVEAWLGASSVPREERIFVGDPPGYYVTTQRPALIVASDGPDVLNQIAREWDVEWLLLNGHYQEGDGYQRMYEAQQSYAGWEPVASFDNPAGSPTVLFRLDATE